MTRAARAAFALDGGGGYGLGARDGGASWFLLCWGSGVGRVDQRSGSDIRTGGNAGGSR